MLYLYFNLSLVECNIKITLEFLQLYENPFTAISIFVQSLSHVRLFLTPQTAARQASLSFTISQSLHKLMSTELVMPSNHLILCHPFLLPSMFPSIRETFTSRKEALEFLVPFCHNGGVICISEVIDISHEVICI